jgi:hypothetical protein
VSAYHKHPVYLMFLVELTPQELEQQQDAGCKRQNP